jgi:hypothetical protein
MARKRAPPSNASAQPAARERPRCNARSTYASILENQDIEEPIVEDQPLVAKEQLAPNPTPEQVLQQLQAELQNTQQERDRLAATFAANQRAI